MIIRRAYIKELSNIAHDVGVVFFASLFLGELMMDHVQWIVVFSGFISALVCWIVGFFLISK